MLFNYFFDNEVIFYSIFVGMGGYKFVTSYLNSFYVDKGIQFDAWEDYSDRPSQIASNNVTSIDTVTPVSETFRNTVSVINTTSNSINIVSTMLPILPVDIEIVPKPDLVEFNIKKSLVENKIYRFI